MNSAARTLVHDEAPDVSKYGLNLNAVSNKSSLGMFDHAIVKPGELKATPQMSSPPISMKTPNVTNNQGKDVFNFKLRPTTPQLVAPGATSTGSGYGLANKNVTCAEYNLLTQLLLTL